MVCSLFFGQRWNANGYLFSEEFGCPGPKVEFTSQVVGEGKLSMEKEWQNAAWLFPHETLRHMFIVTEWALAKLNPRSSAAVEALGRLWEVVAVWVIAHHKGEDHVCCVHFPELFGKDTETWSDHQVYHDDCIAILHMIRSLTIAGSQDVTKAMSDISAKFHGLKASLFQHLAEEEKKFPAAMKAKGWTMKEYCKWVAKDLLPHEGNAVKETNIVGTSDIQAGKRIGAGLIILINCMAVWDSTGSYPPGRQISGPIGGPAAEIIFPPFFVLKAFKKCFEYRWVEPLKIIEREAAV